MSQARHQIILSLFEPIVVDQKADDQSSAIDVILLSALLPKDFKYSSPSPDKISAMVDIDIEKFQSSFKDKKKNAAYPHAKKIKDQLILELKKEFSTKWE